MACFMEVEFDLEGVCWLAWPARWMCWAIWFALQFPSIMVVPNLVAEVDVAWLVAYHQPSSILARPWKGPILLYKQTTSILKLSSIPCPPSQIPLHALFAMPPRYVFFSPFTRLFNTHKFPNLNKSISVDSICTKVEQSVHSNKCFHYSK